MCPQAIGIRAERNSATTTTALVYKAAHEQRSSLVFALPCLYIPAWIYRVVFNNARLSLFSWRCPISKQGNSEIKITQNGISHQSLWRAPVFKFVGSDEDYKSVWLHCDLQICINRECEPVSSRISLRRIQLYCCCHWGRLFFHVYFFHSADLCQEKETFVEWTRRNLRARSWRFRRTGQHHLHWTTQENHCSGQPDRRTQPLDHWEANLRGYLPQRWVSRKCCKKQTD